jgi:hypothetical protein
MLHSQLKLKKKKILTEKLMNQIKLLLLKNDNQIKRILNQNKQIQTNKFRIILQKIMLINLQLL